MDSSVSSQVGMVDARAYRRKEAVLSPQIEDTQPSDGEGRDDRLVIAIPVGGFVPEFTARSGPEPPAVRKVGAKKAWAVAVARVFRRHLGGRTLRATVRFCAAELTNPVDGGTVRPMQDISGKGWDAGSEQLSGRGAC
jgi:hypothetical protein